MKKIYFVAFAVIAVVVGGIAFKEYQASNKQGGSGGRGRMMMQAAVEAAPVQRLTWAVTAEAVGTAYANESVTITSNVSDTVEEIHFEDGQRVKKDQILVVLNHNEEDASLQAAKANLAEQEREVQRLRGLAASKSVSQSLLDERETQRDTAKFQVEAAQARLRDRYIRAPFKGVLGLRNVSVGSFVSPGTVITTLDDIDTIKLDFSVPAVHLQNLKSGLEVRAQSPALPDKTIIGKITSTDSRVNVIDRSLKIRAELPNQDLAIKPGILMNVSILLEEREALVIPEGAIIQEQDKHFVYVIEHQNDKSVAKMREVKIGVRKPGEVEIVSGLEEGEQIVSRGTNTVRNNAPVNIVNQGG